MNKLMLNECANALLIHPGITFSEVLSDRDISVAEFAEVSGYSVSYINAIIVGRRPISKPFASAIALVTNTPLSFWLELQKNYDLDCDILLGSL